MTRLLKAAGWTLLGLVLGMSSSTELSVGGFAIMVVANLRLLGGRKERWTEEQQD